MQRNYAIELLRSLLFLPYIWGGNDPVQGFDCSGLVIEVLKSVGILPREGDWTADGLMKMWPKAEKIEPGCLLFWDWDKSGTADHMEMICDILPDGTFLTIGASGGGSKTNTREDAIRQDAYIKMRPARPEYIHVSNPFLE